ncbi:hypothetical protein I551_2269 [Mycobacterium ulcerans str. Harvey]|uniref:Uncharacterized protein n=1 Tax=Mycobacterium ulcerans str. Harvey TaxID=1299332 RepID=A0ABN0R2F8_MYCUL|nr:hypothetical protein I551_2269 [Mycobacterium ulcerans str. Harvey]
MELPGGHGQDHVVVSYDVSRLMRIRGNRRFVVTLGGHDRVDTRSVIAEMTYSHPLYTPESVVAQRVLPTLDDDRVVFAGPTTAGDSTRTAPHRDYARRGGSEPTGRPEPDRRRCCHADSNPGNGTGDLPHHHHHARRVPVHHSFGYRSYSWYVDVDDLPRLPWWLRPMAGSRPMTTSSPRRRDPFGTAWRLSSPNRAPKSLTAA